MIRPGKRSLFAAAGLIVAAALLLPLGGCREKQQFNIIWVTLDALRADTMSCYGSPRLTSPYLDRLAREGTLWVTTVSQAPSTKASMASIFTSLYPSVHRTAKHGLEGDVGDVLPPEALTLAERLQGAGYRTAAMMSNPHLQRKFGFDQGFEEFHYLSRKGWVDADRVFDEGYGWLEQRVGPEDRFFLYLHLMDTHHPYRPPEPHRGVFLDSEFAGGYRDLYANGRPREPATEADGRYLHQLYEGTLQFSDQRLQRFLRQVEALGLRERTIVVITADHGEQFLDHGGFGHGTNLYQEQLHVPLVIAGPPVRRGGRPIDRPIMSIDIQPTVLSLAGVPWSAEQLMGRDMSALVRGEPGAVAPLDLTTLSEIYTARKCVIDGGFKFIYHGERSQHGLKLFNMISDPGEKTNLIRSRRAVAGAMAQLAAEKQQKLLVDGKRLALPRLTTAIDDRTRNQLRELGYID